MKLANSHSITQSKLCAATGISFRSNINPAGFSPIEMMLDSIENKDTLRALENILSTRLYASQTLAKLDDTIQAAFESAWPQPENGTIAPELATTIASVPEKILHLHQLLIARQQVCDEMARSDAAALPLLQRLGLAL